MEKKNQLPQTKSIQPTPTPKAIGYGIPRKLFSNGVPQRRPTKPANLPQETNKWLQDVEASEQLLKKH